VKKDNFKKLYDNFFKNKLMDFAEHSVANFVIQHLISNTPSEELGMEIVQELSPAFESLLFQNRAGVVAKLSDLCLKFPSLQSPFMEVSL
jgi:nucleolar protein 9